MLQNTYLSIIFFIFHKAKILKRYMGARRLTQFLVKELNVFITQDKIDITPRNNKQNESTELLLCCVYGIWTVCVYSVTG